MQTAGSESTWFYELLAWVQDHTKQVIAGGVAVVAAIFLGYTYQWHSEQQELAASTALLEVTQTSGEKLPAPGSLARVAEEYGSTSAAERALLLEAASLYETGEYASAQQAFDRFVQEQSGSLLAPIAALGAAASLDAQAQEAEAIAAYQKVISAYPDQPVAGRARLNLAAIYAAQDKPAEALKLYDQLTQGTGFSSAAMQAMSRRQELLAAHPELAPQPTNETSAVIAPTPPPAPSTNDAVTEPPAEAPAAVDQAPESPETPASANEASPSQDGGAK